MRDRILAVAELGGIAPASIHRITFPASGRIHTIALVQTAHDHWVVQRVNTAVIPDPLALARLTRRLSTCFDMPPGHWTWPASGEAVLTDAGEHWLCRSAIEGTTPGFPPDRATLQAHGDALRRLHGTFPLSDFAPYADVTVDPWKPLAARRLQREVDAARLQDPNDREAYSAWQRRLAQAPIATARIDAVLHRDPKPSNTLRRPGGELVFIDADTLGPGTPAQDLGETLRALATADDVPAGDNAVDLETLACWAAWLLDGYAARDIGLRDVTDAAATCCLRQCERFLLDHFTGNHYYPVSRPGDNRHRASLQLDAFDLFRTLGSR